MDGVQRRLPVGAEITPAGVHFRVWAPRRRRADVVLESEGTSCSVELEPEPGGYFSAAVPGNGDWPVSRK